MTEDVLGLGGGSVMILKSLLVVMEADIRVNKCERIAVLIEA